MPVKTPPHMTREGRQAAEKLRHVTDVIAERGGQEPTPEAFSAAVDILIRPHTKRGISMHVSPATVYYVEDAGATHLVAVFDGAKFGGWVSDAVCSCDDDGKGPCPHLLAVMAGHSGFTAEPQAMPGPGQAEDNYVNKLACGHELDDPEQLPEGHLVRCTACRKWTKVVASPVHRSNHDRIIGREVIGADDDSPCPLTGIIIDRLDEDRVVVVWGDYTDLADATKKEGKTEWLDGLTPRRKD